MISSMKIASLVVGTLAAVAGAQDMSGFPQCAQWCINSMQQANKSQELGCAANDAACACRNQNFLYGVRDCSAELCASFDTAGQAIGYANEYCRNHGVDLSSVTTGLPSQFTNTNLPTGSGTGTGAGTTTGTGASGGGSQSAVTTSAIVSTATENGSTVVSTVGSTTISSGGAGASASSATSTVPIVSTVTSNGSTFSTTVGSSTLTTQTSGTGGTTGGANGGTTSGTGGATTSSNPNYAPQMTAAPAGLLAAAGVAVFLL